MKKILSLTLFIVVTLVLWLSHEPEGVSRSNGAQLTSNYTGAQGFPNCTQCHTGTLGSGPGTATITLDPPGPNYTPGQTYQVTVTLNANGGNQAKYGFMLAPMYYNDYKGALQATDANCFVESAGRWITHTSQGSSGGTPTKTYTFNWTAPPAGSGPVILWLAANFANGDGGTGGDKILTTALPLNELSASAPTSDAPLPTLIVAPNPARTDIRVDMPGTSLWDVRVFNLEGRCLIHTGFGTSSPARLDVSSLAPGAYILVATDHEGRYAAERLIKY